MIDDGERRTNYFEVYKYYDTSVDCWLCSEQENGETAGAVAATNSQVRRIRVYGLPARPTERRRRSFFRRRELSYHTTVFSQTIRKQRRRRRSVRGGGECPMRSRTLDAQLLYMPSGQDSPCCTARLSYVTLNVSDANANTPVI